MMFFSEKPEPKHYRKIHSHGSENIILWANRRALMLYVGDVVEVMRGEFRNYTGKVVDINGNTGGVGIRLGFFERRRKKIDLINDIHHSNLRIIKLNKTKQRLEGLFPRRYLST